MERATTELEKSKKPTVPEPVAKTRTFVPNTDIYETETSLFVLVDMPGVDEKNVEIRVENNILTIMGQLIQETFPGLDLTYSEYEIGSFERSFTLTDEVDVSRIKAIVKDGVLTLELPKAAERQPHKVTVTAG